jgi:hypothetical protein
MKNHYRHFLSWSICEALFVGALPAAPQATRPANKLDVDESAVFAVVLETAYEPIARGWVMVGARTATFECNPPADIGFDVGGCTGMRLASETAEQRLASVSTDIPDVSSEMIADLISKNRRSTTLEVPLTKKVPQAVWAPGMPTDFAFKGDPVFAAYLSRVGFDKNRTKALVYLGTVNWSDSTKSVGQYVFLVKRGARWVVTAHSQVWKF